MVTFRYFSKSTNNSMFPDRFTSNFSEDIVFECCPNPIWIYDVNTLKFLKVNNEAVCQYGYTEKEFLAMNLEDIRPKGDVMKLVAAIDHINNRSGTYKESYFRHRKKDGTVFPVQLKGTLISYLGRKAELVMAIDISESMDCKRQQYYHKRLFQCITDISNNLIRNENWLEALDACFSILCENLKIDRAYFLQSDVLDDSITLRLYKVRQVKDHGDMDLCKEYLPFPLMKLLMGPIRKGRKLKKNFSALKDTLEKDVFKSRQIKSLYAIPIIVHKKVRGVIGLEDCQEEREWTGEEQQVLHVLASNLSHLINQSDSLEKLLTSEKKFRSLVQNGTDFISILDVHGAYAYVSPTYKSHLGHDPDSLLGTNYFDNVHTSDISKAKKAFKKSLCRDNMAMSLYRFKDSTGKWKWMEAIITNRLSDPNIQGIVVNKSDVTDEISQKIKKELILSITKRLGVSSTLEDLLVLAQKEIGKTTNCLASEIWLKSKDETVLHLSSTYSRKKEANILLGLEKTAVQLEMNHGLPGKVWASQRRIIWDNMQLMKEGGTKETELRTVVGIPILHGTAFLGCVTLYFDQQKDSLALTLRSIEGLGSDLGGVIGQKIVEEEYREFFEISPDPFCVIGYDGRIKLVNNACTKLLGFSEEEFTGALYDRFVHKSDRWKIVRKFIDGVTADVKMDNEIRMVTATNEERWFVWSSTLKRDQKLIFAVAKDITELKRAEIDMEATLTKLQQAQRLGKLGWWYRNLNSQDSEWSPEVYTIHGYTPENFKPTFKNVLRTFHPEDRYLVEDHPNNHLQPGEVKAFEHRIITADGAVKWVHQEIQIVIGQNGKPSHIEGTIQDITERKEYEQQLEASNKRFLLAMLASNQVIWEWDVREASMHYSHVKEGGKEQIIKEPFTRDNSWFARIQEEDRIQVWDTLIQESLVRQNSIEGSMEYRVIGADGSIRYVVDKYRTQRGEDGDLIKVIGSVLDMTQSIEQIERIKSQNKVLTEIAWLQSHAVRGPLTRIMALLKHSRLQGDEKIATEDMLQMISISVNEIDKELHKIIEITDSK